MVSTNDPSVHDKPVIYYHLSELFTGFYERYQIGKNSLGKSFPDRARKSDSYGGNSIWGTQDAIISKYHWTLDYLLWGVSWANVMLMMADAQKTDYDHDKVGKCGKAKHEDNDVLDLSDPKNIDILKLIAQQDIKTYPTSNTKRHD